MIGRPGEVPPSKPKRTPLAVDDGRDLLERLRDPAADLGALGLGAAGLLALLALLGATRGSLAVDLATELKRWLGWAAWLVPVALVLGAIYLTRHRMGVGTPVAWRKIIAAEVALAGVLGLLALISGTNLPAAEAGGWGGVVGWGIAKLLTDAFGAIASAVVLFVITALAGLPLARAMQASLLASRPSGDFPAAGVPAFEAPVAGEAVAEAGAKPARLPREFRKTFTVSDTLTEKPVRPASRDERLPPMDLLESGDTARVTSREINLTAGLIEKTLADFGLPAKVVDFRSGPAVTQFAVEPGFIEHPGDEEGRASRRSACRRSPPWRATWPWRSPRRRFGSKLPSRGKPTSGLRCRTVDRPWCACDRSSSRTPSSRSPRRWRSGWDATSPARPSPPTWRACLTC